MERGAAQQTAVTETGRVSRRPLHKAGGGSADGRYKIGRLSRRLLQEAGGRYRQPLREAGGRYRRPYRNNALGQGASTKTIKAGTWPVLEATDIKAVTRRSNFDFGIRA
jgi:hypothetical protein